MRPLITSIARLPLDDSDIARIVRDAFPEAAENPDDEDHTTFWLVLADQMAKKGIDCADTRAMAIGIIDDGSDERMMAELGMEPADLRKRSRQLQTLREAIAGSPAAKPRKTIKKPQELIMQPGDCLVYPTSAGKCLNSYFASPEDQPSWRQDGWGAAIVLQAERTLGYLAWYRLGVTGTGYSKQPGIGTIAKAAILERPEAGTCSPCISAVSDWKRLATSNWIAKPSPACCPRQGTVHPETPRQSKISAYATIFQAPPWAGYRFSRP
jgi:hypothetical protein